MDCVTLARGQDPRHWVEKQEWVTHYVWYLQALCWGQQAYIDACTCSHPLLASNRCPETLLSSSNLPTGDILLFNGHHSQALLKQALTWRGAPVWKGKLCPALGEEWRVVNPLQYRRVTDFLLVSCCCVFVHPLDLKSFTIITWESEKLFFFLKKKERKLLY